MLCLVSVSVASQTIEHRLTSPLRNSDWKAPKYGTFGSCLSHNRVPSSYTSGYILLFLGQSNLEWNLKATSIVFFKTVSKTFSDFWWSVVTSPVDATIMVPRKLLNHWLTRCYNCSATIGYHSIGMTCWKNPIFHPYLLNNSERNWVTPIFYFRILISRIWRNLWPRVQSHLKVSI